MRSRRIVADATRRWLELQRDLGGDEVIFDQPIVLARALQESSPRSVDRVREVPPQKTVRVPAPQAASAAKQPEPGPVITAGSPPIIPKRYPAGSEPSWLVNAPPIPEAGLVVRTPRLDRTWPSLDAVAESVAECRACPLCTGRTMTVPGEGNPAAGLMVVGEGPGEQEDLSGRPFVGRAGDLLDRMLLAIDAARPTVFIANVVKCRPPRNRAPLPDERAACLPYLHQQIALVRPKVLLALGATAAEALLGVKKPLGALRLKVHRLDGIPLVVTYHPAALLRNPNWKRPAWDDARIARQLLDALD
ncbi:MAG: uracil-DNA glycosylase [Gemmatimonadetes bacterium HGW-Gemmatimonadetes-1]|jgi:DNA polymerase|nr:MAG: uracil-DNA glycosylase [Gemmatimonadetes bacterium HGW-Gemmatimonadetes-1]